MPTQMQSILLLLCLFAVTLMPFAAADVNLFDKSMDVRPDNSVTELGIVMGECIADKDGECDDIILKIGPLDVPGYPFQIGKHELSLRRTFTLILYKESCRFYTHNNRSKHATLRVCEHKQTRDKTLMGTFFDDEQARIDFDRRGKVGNVYLLVRALRTASDDVKNKDRSMAKDVLRHQDISHLYNSIKWIPDLGATHPPVIELFIGIDDSLYQFFDGDKQALMKYVATLVNSADSLWSMVGIRMKLTGVRWWKDLGFYEKEEPAHLMHLLDLYDTFIFGFSRIMKEKEPWFSGVMDYSARKGPDRIPGSPDATMTLVHRYWGTTELGYAEWNYNTRLGTAGIIDLQFTSEIVMNKEGYQQLHYFGDSMTLAHEVGHIMGLDHPEPDDPECNNVRGRCIMHHAAGWMLPKWTELEKEFMGQALENGTYQFMKRQNVVHGDFGTVHHVERISVRIKCFMYFMLIAGVVVFAWTLVTFRKWRQMSVYHERLPTHYD